MMLLVPPTTPVLLLSPLVCCSLPAMPWLQRASSSKRGAMQPDSVARLAEAAAEAAGELVQLCALLPAAPACLSRPAAAAVRRSAAAMAAAAQDASSWGHEDVTAASEAGAPAAAEQQEGGEAPLAAADEQLLQQLAAVAMDSCVSKGKHNGMSPTRPSAKAQQQRQQRQQLRVQQLLQQVQQRWRVAAFKQCVLQAQCRFVARCSAQQAKLVGELVRRTTEAAEAAAGAAVGCACRAALPLHAWQCNAGVLTAGGP